MNHSFGSSRFEGERGKKKKRRGRERKLTKKQKKKEKKREFETRNIGRSCRVCQFRACKTRRVALCRQIGRRAKSCTGNVEKLFERRD